MEIKWFAGAIGAPNALSTFPLGGTKDQPSFLRRVHRGARAFATCCQDGLKATGNHRLEQRPLRVSWTMDSWSEPIQDGIWITQIL